MLATYTHPTPTIPTPQHRSAAHEDLWHAVFNTGDSKRADRISRCGQFRLYRCASVECKTVPVRIRVRQSCREHLCPRHQTEWLEKQVEAAVEAADELANPRLYFAQWAEPTASWDALVNGRRQLAKGMDVKYFVADLGPGMDRWFYQMMLVAEQSPLPIGDKQVFEMDADRETIALLLGTVTTSLDAFQANSPELATYLDQTRRKQFVGRLGKKGRRGTKSGDGADATFETLRAEVRRILRGENLESKSTSTVSSEEIPSAIQTATPTPDSSMFAVGDAPAVEQSHVNSADESLGAYSLGALEKRNADANAGDSHFRSNMENPAAKPGSNDKDSIRAHSMPRSNRGPKVRCPRCGGREWIWEGEYVERGGEMLRLTGPGPDSVPINSVSLTVDDGDAYRDRRAQW